MRVALVSDYFLPRIGGIETHLEALAGELARAGHAVDVLTPMPPRAELPVEETWDDGVRVRRLSVPLLAPWSLPIPPLAPRALADALDDGGYDVVHAHASVVAPLAVAAAWTASQRRLPCVLTHHSVLGAGARVLGAADRVVGWSRWPVLQTAVSDVVARELRAAAPGLDVVVLPNGVHPALWAPMRERGRPDGVVRVAAVTRLAARKRPRALVHLVARLRTILPPDVRVELLVAGDGPERRGVERLARRAGVTDAVHLLGWQSRDQLRALFARCDLFVLPSVRESFGLAALEARCAGLPVVAMRRAGVAEFVRHGHEGLLAADDEELARHVARLTLDAPMRRAMAEHNRRTLPRETWPRVLARHERAYRRAAVLAGCTPPRVRRWAVSAGAAARAAARRG